MKSDAMVKRCAPRAWTLVPARSESLASQRRGAAGLAMVACFAIAGVAVTASGQVGPDGIDWATIGAPGNRAYDRDDPFQYVAGRGSVGYEFRMGRFEITTAQWLEHINAFLARPDPVSAQVLRAPPTWGATRDLEYTGPGVRYRLRTDLPNAGMVPVGGLTWRNAARYCNWLHNDKATVHTALNTGAYDASTFQVLPDGSWLDQRERSPGARYWIPSLDEWMKAAHYDPNKLNGDGSLGGWWLQPNGTDTPLRYAPPPSMGGDGEANAGFWLPNFAESRIPLGSYADVTSPWGLYDVAGGTYEWTESVFQIDGVIPERIFDGSAYGGAAAADLGYLYGTLRPYDISVTVGFRIASQVPSPATLGLLLGGVLLRRRSR